jgi:hypothetical protein
MDRAVDISGRHNLSLLCIMLGSLSAISGIAVLCVESWAWYTTGTWNTIPASSLFSLMIDTRPQPVSGSEITQLLSWLFYQPLDRVLAVSGLATSAIGSFLLH